MLFIASTKLNKTVILYFRLKQFRRKFNYYVKLFKICIAVREKLAVMMNTIDDYNV